jgi:ABC-type amino acid transport substrate-binding protein
MFDAALRAELIPTGRLRVSLNMANPVLAQSHTAPDKPAGVTVDLSRELARRLDVAKARAAVEEFLAEMVTSGFIAESLARHQIAGVTEVCRPS